MHILVGLRERNAFDVMFRVRCGALHMRRSEKKAPFLPPWHCSTAVLRTGVLHPTVAIIVATLLGHLFTVDVWQTLPRLIAKYTGRLYGHNLYIQRHNLTAVTARLINACTPLCAGKNRYLF